MYFEIYTNGSDVQIIEHISPLGTIFTFAGGARPWVSALRHATFSLRLITTKFDNHRQMWFYMAHRIHTDHDMAHRRSQASMQRRAQKHDRRAHANSAWHAERTASTAQQVHMHNVALKSSWPAQVNERIVGRTFRCVPKPMGRHGEVRYL
jgi:hypothetical protein